jgi:hypothetical protein
MSDIHNVIIDKFINDYLPPFLRQRKMFLFLRSLLAPLQTFRNNLVNNYHPLIERKARYNSQVIVFEKLLNDTFNTGTDIFINAAARIERFYFANEAENQPKYFANESEDQPQYIGDAKEYSPLYDFTVNVPQLVYTASYGRIKATIEKYKLVGVNYNIVAY